MGNDLGTLGYGLNLDASQFDKRLAEIEGKYRNFTNKGIEQTTKLEKSIGNAMNLAAGYLSLQGAKSVVSELITIRGEYQQLGNAMEVMLQSKEKGDRLMAQVTQLAATTPFTLSQVGQGAKQLLAYGSAAENIVDELRMLGDISSGVGSEIQDLTYLYGTLRTQGRAMTIDIRQFASRGIPIYQELAKVMHVNVSAVQNLVEKGKVGFKEVEQVFKNLTKEGGQFSGLMAKNSQSLTGLMSNMSDSYAQMMNKIGKSQEGVLADGIKGVTALMNNYEPFLKVIGGAVIVFGSYRTALMLTATVTNVYSAALARQTALYWAGQAATEGLTIKTLLLNTAMRANPAVLIISGIIALSAAIYVYGDHTTRAEKSQKLLNKAHEDSVKAIDEQAKKTGELTFEQEKLIKINTHALLLETELALLRENENIKLVTKTNSTGVGIGSEQFFEQSANEAFLQNRLNIANLKRKIRDIGLSTEEVKPADGTGGNTDEDLEKKLDKEFKTYKEAHDKQNKEDEEFLAKRAEREKEVDENIAKVREEILEENRKKQNEQIENYIDSKQKAAEYEKELIQSVEDRMKQSSDRMHDDYMDKARKKQRRDEENFNKSLDLANQLASLLSPSGQLGQIVGIGTSLASIIGNKDNQKDGKFNFGLGALDLASVGLSAIGSISNAIKQNRAEKEAYYRSVIQYQEYYNLALNDQLAIEDRSALIGNIKGQYSGQFAKAAGAKSELEKLIAKIQNGSFIQLFDKGSGIFGNKPVIELVQLSRIFPGLINADGTINEAKANAILKAGNIPIVSGVGQQQVKYLIQSTLDWNKQLEDAMSAIDQLTTSIGGNLEGSLRSVLIEAFEDGGDAAVGFGEKVGDILEDISSQILFQAVFADSFKKLKEDLDSAFKNGDTDLSQEFGALLVGNSDRIKAFNDGLKQLQEQAKAQGLDVFSKAGTDKSNDQLSGSIKGITEDTASVLAGQVNAIRMYQARQFEVIVQGVEYQRQTAENTTHLLAIKNALSSNNGFRANGL